VAAQVDVVPDAGDSGEPIQKVTPEIHSCPCKCQLRARLSQLTPGCEDKWWTLRDSDDAVSGANELRDVFNSYGLPWLEAVNRFKDARLSGDVAVARGQLARLLAESLHTVPDCAAGQFGKDFSSRRETPPGELALR
jgi:hypothetical protein